MISFKLIRLFYFSVYNFFKFKSFCSNILFNICYYFILIHLCFFASKLTLCICGTQVGILVYLILKCIFISKKKSVFLNVYRIFVQKLSNTMHVFSSFHLIILALAFYLFVIYACIHLHIS